MKNALKNVIVPTLAALLSAACDDIELERNPDEVGDDRGAERDRRQVDRAEKRDDGLEEVDDDRVDNPPFEQAENPEDLRTTAAIRRAVLDAEDISTAGKNVTITTNGGHVVLSGVVEDAEERARIEEIARKLAGADHVESRLEPRPDNL